MKKAKINKGQIVHPDKNLNDKWHASFSPDDQGSLKFFKSFKAAKAYIVRNKKKFNINEIKIYSKRLRKLKI